jgi:hypothetical protein
MVANLNTDVNYRFVNYCGIFITLAPAQKKDNLGHLNVPLIAISQGGHLSNWLYH